MIGGQSSGYPDIAVRGRDQHPPAEFLWYQAACSDWRVIHFCAAYHLNHPCWTLRQ